MAGESALQAVVLRATPPDWPWVAVHAGSFPYSKGMSDFESEDTDRP